MNDQPLNPASFGTPELKRDSAGKFLPGSGGRPKGSFNSVTRAAVAQIQNLSDSALEGLSTAVAAGEFKAISYVLDRILPSGRIMQIDPSTNGVRDALEDGSLSLGELKELAQALNSLKALSELEELRKEMAELKALLRG